MAGAASRSSVSFTKKSKGMATKTIPLQLRVCLGLCPDT
jgi:hypothetical protein